MAIGVLLTSPSEVPGSFSRRIIGVFLSAVIAVVATIVIGYSASFPLLFIPLFILLIFHFSMISIYGFRASLISFSGLLAVVLSLAQVASEGGILTHALWIGAGGLWYLLFSLVVHYFFRRKETDLLLAEAFDLTARYLEVKGQLMSQKGQNDEMLQKELFGLQVSINEKHELIREMVITRRKNFGRSGMLRKRLLVFMELVDILELGMANPVNNERMKQLFQYHENEIARVLDWNTAMAEKLKELAEFFRTQRPVDRSTVVTDERAETWEKFEHFKKSAILAKDREALLIFSNLLSFKEKQYQKILFIERQLREWEGKAEFGMKRQDASRFLTTTVYDIKTLQDNLDFKSPIFRHSLRLTAAMLIGYLLGDIFAVQNAYWILLTILVIMRPGYALTRDRFKQRLYGTLIGGGLAVLLVILIKNTTFYAILAIITLVLAHSMIQRNYKTAAAFITLNVVFIYSLLRPDVLEVIQYRVIDTVVGAGIAFLSAKFLWPTWEYSTIKNFVKESINANKEFIREVELYYSSRSDLPFYRLARKKAFLAMGDLNAAFQRMAQEPKTNEKTLEETFRIVSLNQEFLSATASLGTFIRSNPTTEISEHFKNYMAAIQQNLEICTEPGASIKDYSEVLHLADNYYSGLYRKLLLPENSGVVERKPGSNEELQELQVVMDRLKWLYEISENLRKNLL